MVGEPLFKDTSTLIPSNIIKGMILFIITFFINWCDSGVSFPASMLVAISDESTIGNQWDKMSEEQLKEILEHVRKLINQEEKIARAGGA